MRAPGGRSAVGERSDRQTLVLARAVISSRVGSRSASEDGYSFYIGVLTVLLVAVPVLRAMVLGLADAQTLAVVVSPGARQAVAAGVVALAGAALLIGPTRGPVVPSPFAVEFLAGSALARRVTLLRQFRVSTSVLAGLLVVSACLVGAALMVGGRLHPSVAGFAGVALVVAGCAASAVVLSVLWLVGQSGHRSVTIPVGAGVLLVAGVVVTSAPVAAAMAAPWLFVAAVPAAALAMTVVPRLLDSLQAAEMMRQARRWQSIGTLVQTGDVAGAAGVLRAPPVRGRRDRIALSGPLPIAVVQRDLGAARRYPVRVLVGSLAIVGAGWLLGGLWAATPGGEWPLAVAAALAAYFGVGVWCDGLRNAAENAGPSSIYGRSGLTLIGCHALLPTSVLLVLGAGGIVAGGPGPALSWWPLMWWALISVFVILVRVFDCLKGPLPIGLLLPVPTPVGDVAILNVIAWQSDALIIVLAGVAGLSVLAAASGGGTVVWLIAAGGLVAALAVRRLKALGA